MTQEKTDPAAFLSECARVHEAASAAPWQYDGRFTVTIPINGGEASFRAHAVNAQAIVHEHNTYGALLDVARGLLEERDLIARKWLSIATASDEWFRCSARLDAVDALLAPLSRLAAAGGAR